MGKRSQAWKALEREAALVLGGKRVVRGDWGESDVDVKTEFPRLKVDCKYRQSHAHHSLLEGIRKKYCRHPQDKAVLVTKHRNQHRINITVDGELFGLMLDCFRVAERLCKADPMLFADIAREVTHNGETLEDEVRNLSATGEKP